MLWVGLDLHKRYITACAVDEAGGVVAEHRRLPADAPALLAWLTALPGPVTVAMEATLYWASLHDQLAAAGGRRGGGASVSGEAYLAGPL
jgi:transposase